MNAGPKLISSAVADELAFERASATPAARVLHAGARVRARSAEGDASTIVSLGEIERWFQTVIMDATSIDAGAANAGASVARVVNDATPVGAYEGLGVYHHGYRARLVECLADDYPSVRFAVGGDEFTDLASRYIALHPSRSPNLNGFGRYFEAFVRSQTEEASSFLGDLAALEWSLVEILHAPDAPSLSVGELATLAPERWAEARFPPSPTLRVCRFDFPVNDFFQAIKDGLEPDWPGAARQELAVYRQGFTLWRMALRQSMADLLRSLARGVPLGDALAEVEGAATEPLSPTDVMDWFSAWVQAGFFGGIEVPGVDP